MMEPVSHHATVQNTPMISESMSGNGMDTVGPVVVMEEGPMEVVGEDKKEQGIGVVQVSGDNSNAQRDSELAEFDSNWLIEPGPVIPGGLTLAKAVCDGERVAPLVNDSEQMDKDMHRLDPYDRRGNWLSTQWGGFTFWTVFTLLAIMAACDMGETASRMAKRIIPTGAAISTTKWSSPRAPPSNESLPSAQAPCAEFVDGLPLTLPTSREWTQAVAAVAASELKYAVELDRKSNV